MIAIIVFLVRLFRRCPPALPAACGPGPAALTLAMARQRMVGRR
jgi:hypothetical protein